MAIVLRRNCSEYIKKSVHRLCVFADVPALTSPHAISQALNSWRHALAPAQTEALQIWLQEGEATVQNCTVKISVKVHRSVSATRTGKAIVEQVKAESPGIQIVRGLLAAHKGI